VFTNCGRECLQTVGAVVGQVGLWPCGCLTVATRTYNCLLVEHTTLKHRASVFDDLALHKPHRVLPEPVRPVGKHGRSSRARRHAAFGAKTATTTTSASMPSRHFCGVCTRHPQHTGTHCPGATLSRTTNALSVSLLLCTSRGRADYSLAAVRGGPRCCASRRVPTGPPNRLRLFMKHFWCSQEHSSSQVN
jgi:hypothetical protein